MRTRVIAEIGSTHFNDLPLIRQGLEQLAAADVDAVKFQLFPNDEKYTKKGNIYLKPEIFYESVRMAHDLGLDISASVFDEDSLDLLLKSEPDWVKFAFSQKDNTTSIRKVLSLGLEAIVSCDIMSFDQMNPQATRLLCLPFYPVYYQIRFEGLFPHFDGFSDHTLGLEQSIEAVMFGAKTLEKHVKLKEKGCPDCAFALNLKAFAELTRHIRHFEKERSAS